MNLEPFKQHYNLPNRFQTETVFEHKNLKITVDPNTSKVTILAEYSFTLTYQEYCNLLDKLLHLKKRLKKHHHGGNGVIGTKNKIKAQISELQKQLADLE
jgi:hypothetical protein